MWLLHLKLSSTDSMAFIQPMLPPAPPTPLNRHSSLIFHHIYTRSYWISSIRSPHLQISFITLLTPLFPSIATVIGSWTTEPSLTRATIELHFSPSILPPPSSHQSVRLLNGQSLYIKGIGHCVLSEDLIFQMSIISLNFTLIYY